MFRGARWRAEKNKIKLVFKLHFRVTQVPLSGKDTLTVSLIPLEAGKPTVKSEKSVIQDGTCRWENPVFETVRLTSDTKVGKINDKVYKFIVSTGSSKTGFLGEATINFADYAETIKPVSIMLPLKAANSGAFLHATIQRLQDPINQRENEEHGNATGRPHGRTLLSQLSNYDSEENHGISNGNGNYNSTKDGSFNSGQDQLSMPQNKCSSQHPEPNHSFRASNGSDAISVSSMDSSLGLDTPLELREKNNNHHHQDMASFLTALNDGSSNYEPLSNGVHILTDVGECQRSNVECSVSSTPDASIDGSVNSSEDALLKGTSDIMIEKLKNEIAVLARQAEVSELELQSLRKQIAKESRKGNDLLKEVCSLKEERDALKSECEQLKASQQHASSGVDDSKWHCDNKEQMHVFEEIKQELVYEKDLNDNLRLQLQKMQESNAELILAVRDLEDLLEQKEKEMPITMHDNGSLYEHQLNYNGETPKVGSELEVEESEEGPPLASSFEEHGDSKAEHSLQQKIIVLSNELDMFKKGREELEMQMEQVALDYEILKQENHDMSLKLEQNELQEHLKMQYECESPSVVITELENHVEVLEKELHKQVEAFEADLASVMRAKVEQEQRAVRAEDALRKTKWKNANTAERLQEEINRLSMQLSATFEANEKLAMQALTEASRLRLQKSHLEELQQRAYEDLGLMKDRYEEKLLQLSNQSDVQKRQNEELLFGLEDKSKEIENLKNSMETRENAYSKELAVLRAELVKLEGENINFVEQLKELEKLKEELIQMKTSIEEMEILLQRGNDERDALECKLGSLKDERKKLSKELGETHQLLEEKETVFVSLQSEAEALATQYDELKHSLYEDVLEKENLSKQVLQLQAELWKEDTISIINKKLKDGALRPTVADGTTKPTSKNMKIGLSPCDSKDVSNFREKVEQLEDELKQKDVALESTTHSFPQKEIDLCTRIEELEKCLEEINQNSLCATGNEHRKHENQMENRDEMRNSVNGRTVAENIESEQGDQHYYLDQNGLRLDAKIRSELQPQEEAEISTGLATDQCANAELLDELALLKESNKTMESELKDMQQRYSEISLKFAEVEGERQQLVMTVRYLRNTKKN